ncbi:MAG: GNAT family N-acetyltransferase [Minicystis sp.]
MARSPLTYVPMLDRALAAEAARQNHVIWSGGRSLADHTAGTLRQLDEGGPEIVRYAGVIDARGRLVGALKRYALLLREGDSAPIRAVGIGAVFTKPSMRGRGVASTLLGHVMSEARDLGYEAATLYSDIDPAFYERLGFVAVPARDFTIATADLPARGALEVRRAGPRDLPRLLAWYEAAWQKERPAFLRPARSAAIWRFFRWRGRLGGEWILRHRGRDAGYLMAGLDDPVRDLPEREDGLFWFDEAAAPGVPQDRIWATVRMIAERARAAKVQGWISPAGMPEGAARIARPESFPMIAPLSPALRVRTRRAWLDSFMHF